MTLLRSRSAAYAALALTAALWGSNAVVARTLLDAVPPVALAWLRWIVVLGLLAPFVWGERAVIAGAIARDWKRLLPLAILGFTPQNALIYGGLTGTTAIHVGLLNSSIPVLIMLITATWHGRRPRTMEVAGLLASLAGVLLILSHGHPAGLLRLAVSPFDVLVFGGMLTWALYTVMLKDRPQHLSLLGFVFAAGVLGQLVMAPVFAIELAVKGFAHLGPRELLGLAYLGAMPTLAAMLLFGFGVDRVGPVQAGIFTHLVPVFATLFAATFIGERLFGYHAAGFVLVAGGAIVSCLRQEPVLSSPPPAPTER